MTLQTSASTNAEAERFYLKGVYIHYRRKNPTWSEHYLLRWYVDENIVKVWYDPFAKIQCSSHNDSYEENQCLNSWFYYKRYFLCSPT